MQVRALLVPSYDLLAPRHGDPALDPKNARYRNYWGEAHSIGFTENPF